MPAASPERFMPMAHIATTTPVAAMKFAARPSSAASTRTSGSGPSSMGQRTYVTSGILGIAWWSIPHRSTSNTRRFPCSNTSRSHTTELSSHWYSAPAMSSVSGIWRPARTEN